MCQKKVVGISNDFKVFFGFSFGSLLEDVRGAEYFLQGHAGGSLFDKPLGCDEARTAASAAQQKTKRGKGFQRKIIKSSKKEDLESLYERG